ncbi:hypothetical protein PPERSA_01126 [Pseudocohnilembus persalinus]|uniref:Uncharacterized protein n=1 Tax=Pseudocohnilembus persalinus TaxID=266149 RepID=A0A0V0QVL7_PSEPJ|nr:hypothetical protein PPERSA_01126 [Pseudocohnilembus persalinus]|eukprot:KRX06048.1 hypothetical protein PPERSA_01126 [Pseudocohnilembus persalinus]
MKQSQGQQKITLLQDKQQQNYKYDSYIQQYKSPLKINGKINCLNQKKLKSNIILQIPKTEQYNSYKTGHKYIQNNKIQQKTQESYKSNVLNDKFNSNDGKIIMYPNQYVQGKISETPFELDKKQQCQTVPIKSFYKMG